MHPPVSAGGVEPSTKFSKRRGLDRTSAFRGGLLGKRGVTFFKGGEGVAVAIFTKKINQNLKYLMAKKSL